VGFLWNPEKNLIKPESLPKKPLIPTKPTTAASLATQIASVLEDGLNPGDGECLDREAT
jgi:hypothetical protein